MPPELSEVRQWIEKAEHDRQAARSLTKDQPTLCDVIAFHCQQAVEKFLKAYLVWRGHQFEKVHDLRSLAIECTQYDAGFDQLRELVAPLSAYAVRFRYPVSKDPTPEEVRAALEVVEEARRFILDRLPPEVSSPA